MIGINTHEKRYVKKLKRYKHDLRPPIVKFMIIMAIVAVILFISFILMGY